MEKVFLTDICDIQYGYAFDSKLFSDTKGKPIIRIRDIVRGYSETYTTEECPGDYIIHNDDILIGMDGEFNIALWKGGEAVLNQRVCKLIPHNEICKNYIFYYMPIALKAIEDKTPFVTVKHLSAKELNKIELPLPTYEMQNRIANSLFNLDELIEKRKEQLSKLDELVKARFVELFGDPICNSKDMILSPLNDVCTKITDGTHDTPPRYDSGYLLITGKNIRSSGIIFDDVEFVSEEDHKIIYSRCNPEYGDVLYTNIGVNYGTACYNNIDYEFSMKNVALLKPNHRLVNGYYLWECLNIMRNHILSMNQVGGAQTFMGLATIKKITIPVPPIERQNQFAAFVEQTDKSKLAVQKSLDKLELLKKALMQKFFE